MHKLALLIIKKFKVKFWGIAYETRLPPEFIITKHAEVRLIERLGNGYSKNVLKDLTINAFYSGESIPKSFDPMRSEQSRVRAHYEVIEYRYYLNRIWVFGVRYRKALGAEQKFLITILYWNEQQS